MSPTSQSRRRNASANRDPSRRGPKPGPPHPPPAPEDIEVLLLQSLRQQQLSRTQAKRDRYASWFAESPSHKQLRRRRPDSLWRTRSCRRERSAPRMSTAIRPTQRQRPCRTGSGKP